MSDAVPTGIQLTALDPRFREDPYPVLAELRAREPVHRDTELGRIFFTRHDDVADILRHPDLWSDPRKGNPGSFAREFLMRDEDTEPSMLLMDEPGHRRLRELVRHPFTPRAVERWRDRVRQVAERVIGELEDGEFDLIARVADPIPTVVIAELLGIDPELHGQFKTWSDATITIAFSPVSAPEDIKAAEDAWAGLDGFFRGEIERRRRTPGEDLLSSLLRAEESGDRLSEDEIVSQCNLLLLAGNLTTTDLIGNGVMALLRHHEELAKLRARPELMKNAVEEMLRYDSPVTNSGRIAHEDMEIAGEKVLQGESLAVSLAAANRDPAAYPEPDRFDIERVDSHHQAFGGGRHFCLGAHLARLEAAETLSVLLERFPTLELGEGGHGYASNPSFRGMEHCWVHGKREARAASQRRATVAEPTRQDEPTRTDALRPHAPLTSWYGTDSERERRRYVDNLFNKSAQHYDTVEKIFLNGGLLYRRLSMRLAGMRPGMKVLDVATGTGAVARGAARNVGPSGAVFGCDPNRGMLREARRSFAGPLSRGVAQALPFASGSFDFVTMGIALRHVSDLKATFHEYCRVLKPGGRLWILESHVAKSRVGYALTRFTWKTAIPGLTYLFTRDRDAKELMDYYWDTVDQCVEPAVIVAALRESGFEAARSRVTLPGAFCEYTATRPQHA